MRHCKLILPLLVVVAGLSATAMAAEAGDVTVPFSIGTNVYNHQLHAEGKPEKDTTLNNSFQLSVFPGIGYFVTDKLRLGLNVQFTGVVREPAKPLPSRYSTFAFLPQINYNFYGPLTASLVPTFTTRLQGVEQYGNALQAVLTYAFPLATDLSGTASLEVPVFFHPYESVGVTPLIGASYLLCRSSDSKRS